MESLVDRKLLFRGSIIGNPLYIPSTSLIHAEKIKTGLWSNRIDVSLQTFNIIEHYSDFGKWGVYDFFTHNNQEKISKIGEAMSSILLRILPDDESDEDLREFQLGENVLTEALCKEYIEETSYHDALLRVIDIAADISTQDNEQFGRSFVPQIDTCIEYIEEKGLLQEKVLQVTNQGQGRIAVFPGDYFDDGKNDKKDDKKLLNIEDVIRWLVPGQEPVIA